MPWMWYAVVGGTTGKNGLINSQRLMLEQLVMSDSILRESFESV